LSYLTLKTAQLHFHSSDALSATSEYLSAIDVPLYLLYMESLGDISKQDIQIATDCFYQSIVNALQCAASKFVPRKSREFYKYWWDEELSAKSRHQLIHLNFG